MPQYRIYCRPDVGNPAPPSFHELADDEAAMAHARKICPKDGGAEVWQGARLIGKVGASFELTAD